MVANPPYPVTASQNGIFGDREYVVACKGRPFTILAPTSLPTPPISYVDHKLVTELKLRMSDLQCSRLHYGSKKMRILGKISTSVQCIAEGRTSGNMHFKALVIENLSEHFDVHSIAGIKLNQMLTYQSPSLDQSSTFSESSSENYEPTKTPKKKKKKIPIPNATPLSTPSSTPNRMTAEEAKRANPFGHTAASMARISLEAGYPPLSPAVSTMAAQQSPTVSDRLYDSSSYNSPVVGYIPASWETASPPRTSPPGYPVSRCSPSSNLSRLTAMGGIMVGQLTTASNGPVFYPGHGPTQCLPGCRRRVPPVNCGYNRNWTWPEGFQLCGANCRGAFCDCLRGYNEYGYYG